VDKIPQSIEDGIPQPSDIDEGVADFVIGALYEEIAWKNWLNITSGPVMYIGPATFRGEEHYMFQTDDGHAYHLPPAKMRRVE
jgi:hypothetical protein